MVNDSPEHTASPLQATSVTTSAGEPGNYGELCAVRYASRRPRFTGMWRWADVRQTPYNALEENESGFQEQSPENLR